MNRIRLTLSVALAAFSVSALAQDPFQVNLDAEPETIGDLRPVFLEFRSQALPAISPVEVSRRYKKLFETSDEPEVRIDALNRLNNLENLTEGEIGIAQELEQQIYLEALDSYESILARGSYHGKLDEMLYQMAKAHALVGEPERSIDRLKQLTAMYPESDLVPEAWFRIGESYFAGGEYGPAEQQYLKVLDSESDPKLQERARYMLGWSQYKQGERAFARAAETFLKVLDANAAASNNFMEVPASATDMVQDTFRILAIMAARDDGPDTIADWLDQNGNRDYQHLLYDRLADYYAVHREFERSVSVNRNFVSAEPRHPARPEFLAQIVDVWLRAGETGKARQARADYVNAFFSDADWALLDEQQQARWQDFSRRLADHHYNQGKDTGAADQFRAAGRYYQQLALRAEAPGEPLRLAGDSWLQAGDYQQALASFQAAAYQSGNYDDADDAAWASLTLQRDLLDGELISAGSPATIEGVSVRALADNAERFGSAFPADDRLAGLNADLANRLSGAGMHQRAVTFARASVDNPAVAVADAYSAWLAMGQSLMATASFDGAERAWRSALGLVDKPGFPQEHRSDAGEVRAQLAASIYRQAEQAVEAGATDTAVAQFLRVQSVLPGSEIAITARFDAANTLLNAQRWQAAINELQRFRKDYPSHRLSASISEKLVFAYQESGQPVRAGDELMAGIARAQDPAAVRVRAAALYHQGDAIDKRNRLYLQHLETQGRATTASAHVLNQTMRKRLVDSGVRPESLRLELLNVELASDWHSDQTLSWAATIALDLGQAAAGTFQDIRLTDPLPESLGRKQAALERARSRFEQAARLGSGEQQARAMYHNAELSRQLARDLMDSERPQGLSDLELAQYDMLLEEEAYPFEEQAIRMHARNHERVGEEGFNEWVGRSLEALSELFPGRYQREPRWMGWQQEGNDGA